jgi:NAD(P)H-dependent flavin oxidoreductase YrpB (nitropropane dioxygenase family)
MKPYRPILKHHRLQRLVLWALVMLQWIAAALAGHGIGRRHLAQRGDVSLAWLTRFATDLLFIRATHIGRLRLRGPTRYWRHGRDLRRRHFRRSLLGARLRRALKHKNLVTHIARLIGVLRDLDAHATRLWRNLRRRRRLWRTTPPIARSALWRAGVLTGVCRQLLTAPTFSPTSRRAKPSFARAPVHAVALESCVLARTARNLPPMLNSQLCQRLGIEFPLFAFSHCRDVVVAVSKAGGMGVLGAVGMAPQRLKEELDWIEAHVGGKPYGLDLIVPNKFEGKGETHDTDKLLSAIPDEHKKFAAGILAQHGVDASVIEANRRNATGWSQNLREEGAAGGLEVAFQYPIKLIANALGLPPPIMLELGKKHGVAVAALVGAKEHALAQAAAGVDIIIAAGGEAGGHCGDVSTMVLVPEVVRALEAAGSNIPVLAAGGIVTGEQMAAAMAMGAAGAWCGSVWLTTPESEVSPAVREKLLAATSRDTIRSRSRTGKPSRQLRSPWTDAWESDDAPKPLPMPLQSFVTEPALRYVDKLSDSGHAGARELATYWVGQGVGLMNEPISAGAVVQQFKEDFARAYERLAKVVGD